MAKDDNQDAVADPDLYAGGDVDNSDIDGLGGDDRGDSVEATAQEQEQEQPKAEAESEGTDESAQEEAATEASAEEDSAEAEEDAAKDGDEDTASRTQEADYRIPKHRLDDEIAKRRALEKRLAELEAKSKPKEEEEPKLPDFDFAAQEKAYMEAVLDGETEKAAQIRQEIRQAEKAAYEAEFSERMNQTKAQTRAELEMEQAVAEITRRWDVFDTESENFDADLTSEAVALRDTFMSQGYGIRDALNKATRYVLAANNPELLNEQQEQRPASTPASKPSLGRKVAAANKQPPPMQDTAGARSNNVVELDVNKISEEDFEALPASKLAELRGDVV